MVDYHNITILSLYTSTNISTKVGLNYDYIWHPLSYSSYFWETAINGRIKIFLVGFLNDFRRISTESAIIITNPL